MANLIAKVSASNNNTDGRHMMPTQGKERRLTSSSSNTSRNFAAKESDWKSSEIYSPASDTAMNDIFDSGNANRQDEISVVMKREVEIHVERRKSAGVSSKERSSDYGSGTPRGIDTDEDTKPLKEEDREAEEAKRTGVEKGMGVYTKVWGP